MINLSSYMSALILAKRWRLVFGLVCCLEGQQAIAGDGLSCTEWGSIYTIYDLGVVQPAQPFSYSAISYCTTIVWWNTVGLVGYVTQNQEYNGNQGPRLSVKQNTSGITVPDAGRGLPMWSGTASVSPGIVYSFDYIVTGTAAVTPGIYVASVQLFANRGVLMPQMFRQLIITYTVSAPPCALGSGVSLSLPFGTLTSEDFATTQRIAEISVNCPYASSVTAVLEATQSAVVGKTGVSATTLDGLSMTATWADSGSPVAFSSPRTIALTKGDNVIRLGFRPQLNSSDSPVGEFSSQYTLNLTYP